MAWMIFLLCIAVAVPMLFAAPSAGSVLAVLAAWRRCGVAPAVALAVLIVASPVLAWKWHLHRHALAHLPEALDVDTVEFRAEERWGLIGFGDADDIGLLLYALPPEQARRIARGGIPYLERLPYPPQVNAGSWRGRFHDWRETPLPGAIPFTATSHLCDFEDCPAIPAEVRTRVERVMSQPGSYYARGRIGTIVVSPAEKLVVFYYSGL